MGTAKEKDDSFESDASVDDRRVDEKISWTKAAWVINAAVIGIGVLTLPKCFSVLGWICGFLGLIVCLGANLLVAQIMLEIREVYPRAISLADAAFYAFGSRSAKTFIRWTLYFEKVACTAVYVSLMASTLGSSFYTLRWCLASWCLVIVVVFLPLMRLKNFSETHLLNIINFVTILLVVGLTSAAIVQQSTTFAPTSLWPQAKSFSEAFGACAMMVFAFSGNWMYFELMAEMENPQEFMRSFCIAGPAQLGLYSVTAFVGYAFMGTAALGQFTDALKFGTFMRIVSLLLTIHIVAGTGTNIVVLIRFFHSRISPKTVNSNDCSSQLLRTCLYTGLIAGCIFVTLVVPSYLSIVVFVGALFEAPISFILPMVLYYAVVKKHHSKTTCSKNPFAVIFLCIIVIFGGLVTVLGLQDALANLNLSGAAAFSCQCIGMWNTCDCSPFKMPVGACSEDNLQHAHSKTTWLK